MAADQSTGGALTAGVHHVGLSVADLDASEKFFTRCLGWQKLGGVPEYPSSFVSDGSTMVTLWQVAEPARAVAFDRRRNVGLHHLALAVAGKMDLDGLFAKVSQWPGVKVEFAPEPFAGGAMVHAMVYEPGGTRLEFACPAG